MENLNTVENKMRAQLVLDAVWDANARTEQHLLAAAIRVAVKSCKTLRATKIAGLEVIDKTDLLKLADELDQLTPTPRQ